MPYEHILFFPLQWNYKINKFRNFELADVEPIFCILINLNLTFLLSVGDGGAGAGAGKHYYDEDEDEDKNDDNNNKVNMKEGMWNQWSQVRIMWYKRSHLGIMWYLWSQEAILISNVTPVILGKNINNKCCTCDIW